MAMSAVKALVRFRGRVDGILALKEASADLPFALPPAPVEVTAEMSAVNATWSAMSANAQTIISSEALVNELAEAGTLFEL